MPYDPGSPYPYQEDRMVPFTHSAPPPVVAPRTEASELNLPFKQYFPNYPGDPLEDLLRNQLINWFKLFQKSDRIKGAIMNAGMNPNYLIANQPQRIGSYGIPKPSGLNFPSNYQPNPPSVIQNFTAASQFKPGPTFRYATDPGGTRYGVQDLPNNPGLFPAQSAPTLEGLLEILRKG